MGRAGIFDAGGLRRPAQLRVVLVQERRTVASADTDAQGRFRMAGVRPGTYTVIGTGEAGVSIFSLQVLPAEKAEKKANSPSHVAQGALRAGARDAAQSAPPVQVVAMAQSQNEQNELPLDMSLIPNSDSDLVSTLRAAEAFDAGGNAAANAAASTTAADNAPAGGGGGGGGGDMGGLGALLGALGAALGGGAGGIGGGGGGGGRSVGPASSSTPASGTNTDSGSNSNSGSSSGSNNSGSGG